MSESEQEIGFDLGEPPQPITAQGAAYRVLARKYRPQKFSELIGQDAMVQTLANAIKRGRLAHAFLLTGIRGTGKTSTARLMAKALNCETGPTIDPCGTCDACVSITEGRHLDVIEMDAASHTGVDDVREIIEAARYAAVSARYKIYIIDEVHMLSKNAFNALLKTLEEPPAHVKFLFATTEIQKVPITVLSRCQRFDLRRIPVETLSDHFRKVCAAENVSIDPEALNLIARAADGSARDGLSILDQAIAHAAMDGAGQVQGEQVRTMLGLADKGAIRDLFDLILNADPKAALAAVANQHALGVDALAVIRGLMQLCHATTIVKTGANAPEGTSAETQQSLEGWANRLSFGVLHRIWQLLLKGHDEVIRAPDMKDAGDMAILRLVHAAHMPDPAELLKKAEAGGIVVSQGSQAAASSASGADFVAPPSDFAGLIAMVEQKGHALLAQQLHDYVGLVSYSAGELNLRPIKPLPGDFASGLASTLKKLTNMVWIVNFSDQQAEPSLREQELATEMAARDAILASPVIAATMQAFPDAELLENEGHTLQ